MPETPILSYKKQSSSSRPQSPAVSGSFSPQLPVPTTYSTTRKVSSRRKALQEFYNIQKQEEELQDLQNGTKPIQENGLATDPANLDNNSQFNGVDLNDPKQLDKFIKTSKIEEILKVRNSITNHLNSHDSEKKSIIYDNYYELIKLSQTLDNLSKPKPPAKSGKVEGLGIYHQSNEETGTNDDYIASVLKDLSSFLEDESTQYGEDFETVIKNINRDFTESDENASIVGIRDVEEASSFPGEIDRIALAREISSVIDSPNNDPNIKPKVIDEIQSLLKILDSHKDELLILQLNDLKRKLI